MFPGMEKGIRELTGMLPQVEQIVFQIGKAIGALARESGQGLTGAGFEDFFDFLERQAKPMLVELGQTIGNFVEGFAAMVVAFEPLSTRFSAGLLGVSEAFAEWALNEDAPRVLSANLLDKQGLYRSNPPDPKNDRIWNTASRQAASTRLTPVALLANGTVRDARGLASST